ncbi:MAG: tetratricopeptide repeat protein [Planctomycetota bacterium]|jgi:tetratricopeptide (TPR) repeat protein|nr:tetratricopeptide repeat protein [Planctomycetota bacterium]
MPGTFPRYAVALTLALLAAGGPEAAAAPRTGVKKPKISRQNEATAYSLEEILKGPDKYIEREVFFYCRFATTANLFKSVSTRFNANEHANFAVWPDKTVLWEEKGRKNILPTLYVPKYRTELLDALRSLRKYELVAVTGRVMNVYGGYPWILVAGIERVELPGDRLDEPVIEHMQNGMEALDGKAGGVAARHFEQALRMGLPPEYLGRAYEKAAYAHLLESRLDSARDYLRQAVEYQTGDPLLNLALADVTLKMNDPAEALAQCEFALDASGRHPQVYGIMGEARALLGNYPKAFSDLNAAAGTPGITAREKAMVNIRRARVYRRAGRDSEAARLYAAASDSGEALAGESWLHLEIGIFYESLFLLGENNPRYLDSAVASYGEAARLSSLDPFPLYCQAEAELRRQKAAASPSFAGVRLILEQIDRIEPEYVAARIIEGRALFAEGKAQEAEQRYQMVAGRINGDAVALMALAEAYIELGRPGDAADAVRRARALEPWNSRVAGIGPGLERLAARDGQTPAGGRAPGGENGGRPGDQARNLPAVPGGRPYRSGADYPPPGRPAAGREFRPAPEGNFPAPVSVAGAFPNPGPEAAGVRRIAVNPGDRIRIGSRGEVSLEETGAGRDIQAIVQPAPLPGRPPYPPTEVRLPEAIGSSRRRVPAPDPAGQPASPLDLGYNPGAGGLLDPGRPYPEEMDFPAGNPVPDEWIEPEVWDYETFQSPSSPIGWLGKGEAAYASLAPGGKTVPGTGGGRPALPAFSFAPGRSPLLIPSRQTPAESARRSPVRNSHLFRRLAGDGRRPAEIIENAPVPMPGNPDLFGPPPPDGAPEPPRAEVRLPSHVRGIGLARDFVPGA